MRIVPLTLMLTSISLAFNVQKQALKFPSIGPTYSNSQPKPLVKDSTKKLVWADEFNTPGHPDTAKWAYNIGTGNNGWGNNELEYYTNSDSNARVENGNLIIEARKENVGGKNYTSARMLTQGKFDWTYGRFEIRAKLPAGVGSWPAIWMLGSNIDKVGWPACGEIDIMEHVGKSLNEIHWSAHSKLYNWPKGTQKTAKAFINEVTATFHVYALDWSKESMKFYVDNVLYLTVKNENKSIEYYPFEAPQFLLLNLAVGGGFGGPKVDDNIFPIRMEVDYVRVYQ